MGFRELIRKEKGKGVFTFAGRLQIQRGYPHRVFVVLHRQVGDLASGRADCLVTGEEYLDVWVVWGGQVGVPHAGHLGQTGAREGARLIVQVLVHVGLVEHRVELLVQREVHAERLVVVQILPDARQIGHHVDLHRLEMLPGPYPGQHEQLGRVHRACRQDHFPFRQYDPPPSVLKEREIKRIE